MRLQGYWCCCFHCGCLRCHSLFLYFRQVAPKNHLVAFHVVKHHVIGVAFKKHVDHAAKTKLFVTDSLTLCKSHSSKLLFSTCTTILTYTFAVCQAVHRNQEPSSERFQCSRPRETAKATASRAGNKPAVAFQNARQISTQPKQITLSQ